MVAYARFLASELPKAVGLDAADGRRKSDGRAGHLCHGPYITLGPGRYTAGFFIQRDPGDDEGEVEHRRLRRPRRGAYSPAAPRR